MQSYPPLRTPCGPPVDPAPLSAGPPTSEIRTLVEGRSTRARSRADAGSEARWGGAVDRRQHKRGVENLRGAFVSRARESNWWPSVRDTRSILYEVPWWHRRRK
eukprot:4939516-Pyramimonas_sp.AAC.2